MGTPLTGRSARRERAAVIGSGVAGLTAAHLLQRRYDVSLIEADDRLGGHAHTRTVSTSDAGDIAVDSGFIVHNRVTYPNLVRLFDDLGVQTRPTDMSMSVRCDGCGLEYAGAIGLRGVFARRRSVVDRNFLWMLLEVNRFHRAARKTVAALADRDSQAWNVTLGEFLASKGFTEYFRNHFMVPVVSAVWSVAPETALDYPAAYLFSFLANHGMLSVRGSHQWYTVVGGSKTYVDATVTGLSEVRLSTRVVSVARVAKGCDASPSIAIDTETGGTEHFDKVVVATHPDQALRMLAEPTDAERSTLGAFTYSRNEVALHRDVRVLPRNPEARASWNYLLPACRPETGRALVSYDMNRLAGLPGTDPHIVTLNCDERIAADRVIERMLYEHPIYTPTSVGAQRLLPALNDGTLAFAGAYHGWGFHEDGCLAGVKAASSLGVDW